jgi:hypothetical protein
MPNTPTRHIVITGALLFVFLLILFGQHDPRPPASALGIPTVMRTQGGLLEVATVEAYELFSKRDTRSFLFVPLGETASEVRAPVTYRYHVQLAREWPVRIEGTTATVVAPPIRASVPVAIDTAQVERRTQEGWMRFNGQESLDTLERSMSAVLEKRATSPRYMKLMREDARKTVQEFVTQWLLSEAQWKRKPGYSVVVIFEDEQPATATATQP